MAAENDLPIWNRQLEFYSSIKVTAEYFFNSIDIRLKPNVFLIGFPSQVDNKSTEIQLIPNDTIYSRVAFKDVDKLALELEKVDSDHNIFNTHETVQENHLRRISVRAKIEALKRTLAKEDLRSRTEKFVSYPITVNGFSVYVVLELNKEILHSNYSLKKSKFNDRYQISRSFVESCIEVFLGECSDALKNPEAGLQAIKRRPDELLQVAGREFMYSISQAGKNFMGLHGLYDACNSISALKYEGAEGLGGMLICEQDHPNVRFTLELTSPIDVDDFRKVRKFLELSTDETFIVTDSKAIYGLGVLKGNYNPQHESLFVINFLSHYKWQVKHDNNVMMVVEYRQPNLPKERIDRTKFFDVLKRTFPGVERRQLEGLWDIASEATKQKHGTMIVISTDAAGEAIRLGKQCFSIKPRKTDLNMIQQITSIDGAVLIDTDSLCHAVGVILDGVATTNGDSSRGARYNSAIRYFDYVSGRIKTAIIIISEDGMINLIPDLRPQIKHREILNAIEKMDALSASDKVDRKAIYGLMEYFTSISFYLTEAECIKINSLRVELEKKIDFGNTLRIIYSNFEANPEMNDSYYLPQ